MITSPSLVGMESPFRAVWADAADPVIELMREAAAGRSRSDKASRRVGMCRIRADAGYSVVQASLLPTAAAESSPLTALSDHYEVFQGLILRSARRDVPSCCQLASARPE